MNSYQSNPQGSKDLHISGKPTQNEKVDILTSKYILEHKKDR